MINSLIQAQLNNCRIAQIPKYDPETVTVIEIPKGTDYVVTQYQIGTCYFNSYESSWYMINFVQFLLSHIPIPLKCSIFLGLYIVYTGRYAMYAKPWKY